jgi:hypothetical protein
LLLIDFERIVTRDVRNMSTAEMLLEKAKHLPENLQAEAVRYVDFLLMRQAAEKENTEWAQFSSAQLAEQYSPEDATYDDDSEV